MNNDFQIQSIAELIERGLCIFDEGNNIDDRIAKSIVERLLDKYHFQENSIFFESGLEEAGFAFVNGHIEKNFGEIPNEVISKVLCTILRSIRRHTIGRSEYLDFTHQFFNM